MKTKNQQSDIVSKVMNILIGKTTTIYKMTHCHFAIFFCWLLTTTLQPAHRTMEAQFIYIITVIQLNTDCISLFLLSPNNKLIRKIICCIYLRTLHMCTTIHISFVLWMDVACNANEFNSNQQQAPPATSSNKSNKNGIYEWNGSEQISLNSGTAKCVKEAIYGHYFPVFQTQQTIHARASTSSSSTLCQCRLMPLSLWLCVGIVDVATTTITTTVADAADATSTTT